MIYMDPDATRLMHDNIQMNTHMYYAPQLTKSTHWLPCHSHTSPQPPMGHHASTHDSIPSAPQLTCSDTRHHSRTAPIPCASRHQPTTPHVSHMPSQANSHADTSHMASCTWDPQAPLPSFFSQGCFQVPGEGAAALLRPTRGLSSRESPGQPTLPQYLPFHVGG